METFGERLKRLRKEKNMTQEMLASNFGMKKAAIWGWENSKSQPDVETLYKLSKILEVDLTYLIGGENKINEEFYNFEKELIKRGMSEKDIANLSEDKKRLLYKIIEDFINHID